MILTGIIPALISLFIVYKISKKNAVEQFSNKELLENIALSILILIVMLILIYGLPTLISYIVTIYSIAFVLVLILLYQQQRKTM